MYPNRPHIRKLGTIACDMVETTPLVFKGELYRFECFRARMRGTFVRNHNNTKGPAYFRLIHVRSNTVVSEFAENHHLGYAFVDGDTVYAMGIADGPLPGGWGGDTVHFFRSNDLRNWEQFSELHLPGWELFTVSVCKMGDTFTLVQEFSKPESECGPYPFTFRFFHSKDMIHWEKTPWECAFQRDRYAGAATIYTLNDDPHYYVVYLEQYPLECYATCVARSKDLIHWEYSPINPVLMYDDVGDKQIASPFLTLEERQRIQAARNVNASDLELCEYLGRTIMYYSWGDQHGTEFLAEACYEGPMKELLQGFFPQNEQ